MAQRFTTARRRATTLLAVVAVVFVTVAALGEHGTMLGYVEAGAEASVIGGLADWFAVTALFRHPLRLPIPHTAIIVERKDQFAATLGRFVQENFLNGDVLSDRIRGAGLVLRAADWLAESTNAVRFAGQTADLVVELAEAIRDEDVQKVLTAELTRALERIDVTSWAGKGLRLAIAGGRHDELFDSIVTGCDKYLVDHYLELRQLFEAESPTWVPDSVDRLVFDRLHARGRKWLAAMLADPESEARCQFKQWLAGLSDRLETSPQMRERGELFKRDLLHHAELRDWSSSLWQELKDTLRIQAAQPDSEIRRRLAEVLTATGRRLRTDARLQESVERVIESVVHAFADRFHDELASLVTGTIDRWDATETANQLELLLGRDLQFIRINGTVVGAAVGLGLHAIAMGLT